MLSTVVLGLWIVPVIFEFMFFMSWEAAHVFLMVSLSRIDLAMILFPLVIVKFVAPDMIVATFFFSTSKFHANRA